MKALPPFPTRLNKWTRTKKIDGTPLVYKVVDEIHFPAKSNPQNKLFSVHKFVLETGETGFRIGYYMIAHKPRMKGKWAWGQFAPMMTDEEMAEIFQRLKTRGWLKA